MNEMHLRAAEDMAGGVERDPQRIVDGEGLAIAECLRGADARLAIAARHDAQGLGGGEDMAVAGARMVGMAMGYYRAGYRARGIDISVGRDAVEPLRADFEPMAGMVRARGYDHGDKIGGAERITTLGRFIYLFGPTFSWRTVMRQHTT